MNDKIKKIANKYGVKEVIFIKKGDEYCEANGEDKYINRSYIIGNDTIVVGIYKNKELLTASFFHELGHIFNSNKKRYNTEFDAWMIGFSLARKHRFLFKEKTYLWAMEQLATYLK